MSDLVPSDGGSLLPSTDRRVRRALAEIDQRASVIEAAAERRMEMAARLNHGAKLRVVADVTFSRQLKEIAPEASQLLDDLDVHAYGEYRKTLRKALK